jgi:hypothetical protein
MSEKMAVRNGKYPKNFRKLEGMCFLLDENGFY